MGSLRGVDLRASPEAEAFRAEVRAFLAEQLPDDWPGIGALPADEAAAFVGRLAAARSTSTACLASHGPPSTAAAA